MKVLFVVSGSSQYQNVAPSTRSLGDSLAAEGVDVAYFTVKGGSIAHHWRSARSLRRHLKAEPVDIVHAHHALSGWVAALAAFGRLPLVLSYDGPDVLGSFVASGKRTLRSKLLAALGKTVQLFMSATICKSQQIAAATITRKRCHLIPDGVRLERFKAQEKIHRKELGLDKNTQYVLFLADPSDPNKNVALVEAALEILNKPDVELLIRYKISHHAVPKYLNTADVFAVSSFSEGASNLVKEAMACNCPIVATNVGDVAWVLGDTPGCYLSPSHKPTDFAKKLRHALQYSEKYGRTKGRERILALGLDAKSTARKVIGIYEQVSNKKLGTRPSPTERLQA
ncbi:MAG: glycosyltransferase family 4 protein [Saprospiraceae bacterium]|nr:glycosyltransferase family 4 protein [Saprospiraceae bacterium]